MGPFEPSLLTQKASALLQFTTTAFAIKDLDGIILDANPAFCQMMGYERSELLGKHHSLITHPKDREKTAAVLELFRSGQQHEHQWVKRYVTKPGTVLTCQMKLSLLGEDDFLILQLENISRERQLIAEKEETQRRLQGAIDAIPGMVALWDPDLRNIFANKSYIEYFGKTPEEIRGLHIRDVLGPDLFAKNEPFLKRALTGETVTFERTIPTPSGSRNTHAAYIPMIEAGKVGGVFVFVTDNSELKQAQLSLHSILDSATDVGIISFDLDSRIWVFSRGAELLLGYPAEDILGSTRLVSFFDPDELRARELELSTDQEEVLGVEVLTRPLGQSGEHRRSWTLVQKDGTRISTLVTVSPIQGKDGTRSGYLLLIRDTRAELETRRKLFEAMEKAEDASLAKSQFLANMSHEIRTPLNGVLGIAQVLAETQLTAQQSEYLSMIQSSGQSLLQILNDVLDFSKVEAGRMDIQEVSFAPKTVLRTLESLFDLKAKEKGLDFLIERSDQVPPFLVGDPLRLQQVLVNLVGNAIKFTSKGRVVLRFSVISSQRTGGLMMQAEVQDTGIGMTEDQVAKLFQPFVQADSSTSQRFGGTGLGLAISHQLVDLMGGELTVTSQSGTGCCFRFTLPTTVGESTLPEATETFHEKAGPIEGTRILLVEDGPINQVVAKALLEKVGAQVTVCNNGQEAVVAFQEHPDSFDLVLMDVQMPEMNGLEATQILRRDLKTTIPIIALTAGAMAEERIRCLEAGMDDFLAKPFKRTEMLATIGRHLEKAHVVEPEASSVGVADLNKVLQMDQELFDQVMNMFRLSLGERALELSAAWESRATATLAPLLHSLKGTSGNLAVTTLSEACLKLEGAISAGAWDQTETCYQALMSEVHGFQRQLDDYFSTKT